MGNRDEAILGVLHAAGHMRYGTFDRLAMKELFAQGGVEFPDSGAVSWAPLFTSFGDDALRFQLIFDLCEDLLHRAALAHDFGGPVQCFDLVSQVDVLLNQLIAES